MTLLTLALCAALILPALALGRGQPNGDLLAYAKISRGIYLMDVPRRRERLVAFEENLVSLVWSPNGRAIAYTLRLNTGGEIYLIDIFDGDKRNVSRHPADDGIPVWSPDGSRLAFVSYRDDNSEIYVMALDDGQLLNATRDSSPDYNPVWSDDGTRLIFDSYRGARRRNRFALELACLNTAQPCAALGINPDEAAVWLPPARTDVYVSGTVGDIYLRRGSRTHRLTYDSINFAPAWQPSANR